MFGTIYKSRYLQFLYYQIMVGDSNIPLAIQTFLVHFQTCDTKNTFGAADGIGGPWHLH